MEKELIERLKWVRTNMSLSHPLRYKWNELIKYKTTEETESKYFLDTLKEIEVALQKEKHNEI